MPVDSTSDIEQSINTFIYMILSSYLAQTKRSQLALPYFIRLVCCSMLNWHYLCQALIADTGV